MKKLLPFLLILCSCSTVQPPPNTIEFHGDGKLIVTLQQTKSNNIFTSLGESLGGIASKIIPFLLP